MRHPHEHMVTDDVRAASEQWPVYLQDVIIGRK